MGEFDGEFCLARGRAGSEDVEDEFAAVDDFAFDGFLDGGDLGGGEEVVEDDDTGAGFFAERLELVELAGAQECAGVGVVLPLEEFSDGRGACGFGERAEFAQWIALIEAIAGCVEGDEDCALLAQADILAFFGLWHDAEALWDCVSVKRSRAKGALDDQPRGAGACGWMGLRRFSR